MLVLKKHQINFFLSFEFWYSHRMNFWDVIKSKCIHRYLWIESLKLVNCLQTHWKLNSFEIERLCLFSQVFCDPICFFFQFPFLLDSKLLRYTIWSIGYQCSSYWWSPSCLLEIMEDEPKNFHSMAHIQQCENQVPQLNEMSTRSYSSDILRGPRGLVLPRESTIRSCLLIQEQFHFWSELMFFHKALASLEICRFHLCSQDEFYFGLRLDFCECLSFHSSQKWFWVICRFTTWFNCVLICETLEGRLFFLRQFQHLIINFVDELCLFELCGIFYSKFLCFHQ